MVIKGTAESYRVFVRNWWRWEYASLRFPGDKSHRRLVPDPGARKTIVARHCTEAEARRICDEYAETHKPGPLSRKAEYTREV